MTPESEAALADIVTSAKDPLAVQGGGTRGIIAEGEVLSLAGLSGITLYEPGALTLVAQAGTPVAEIEAALAAENQRLAFEPMDPRALLRTGGAPTLGGVIAANVSGPRRIQGGAARDYALGVRFVDGKGEVVQNGGRVMKNVTGYDLVKLMCGAFGTLGVLTEVSLKVLPRPETEGTLLLRGLSDARAVEAMAAAMASPFEVTGAAHCATIIQDGPVTALRVEGFERSVVYRLEQLKALLARFGAEMTVGDAAMSEWIWRSVRDAELLRDVPEDIWRVCCKPSEAPGLMARSGAVSWYYDWAGGRIWVRMPVGQDLRAALGAFDGHATLVRAAPETRRALPMFHPEAPGVAKISAGLRARFDPRGILNRGLMGPVAEEVA
ncbi:2-hydroxy-acid oxidase [Roseobacter cerasinus]|uniref:2-hydroxy-acid oxidase n=1 Tax=Roseobacter cerasinus TaxID=2602289 RepID=A0A640VRG6_9RHOB|nr:FAD-binding protein [Roseobacter cerasinus]GFE49691.1 2-hydroxy-acid oxidase [Roseobacter cerasinus]